MFTYENGDKLECELIDGRAEGKGIKNFANEVVIECDGWKDGEANGRGTMTYVRDGITLNLECSFRNGVAHGEGVERSADGYEFECQWIDGEPNGNGVERFPNGDVFKAEYKDGWAHGSGILTYINGSVFRGAYKDGEREGHGVLQFSTGDVLECYFENDELNGSGVWTYQNGDKLEIEYKNGEACKGIKTFKCGDVLTCEKWTNGVELCSGFFDQCSWYDEEAHGKGTLELANGDVIEGEWKNGKLQTHAFYKTARGDVFVMKSSDVVDCRDD